MPLHQTIYREKPCVHRIKSYCPSANNIKAWHVSRPLQYLNDLSKRISKFHLKKRHTFSNSTPPLNILISKVFLRIVLCKYDILKELKMKLNGCISCLLSLKNIYIRSRHFEVFWKIGILGIWKTVEHCLKFRKKLEK